MIKANAFLYRQAFEKKIVFLLIFFMLLLILMSVTSLAYLLKDDIVSNLLNPSYSKQVFSRSMIIKKIIENEITLYRIEPNYAKTINEAAEFKGVEAIKPNINNDIEIELQREEKVTYNVPNTFETKVLENGKILVGNTKISNYSKLNLNLEELSKPARIRCNANSNFLIYHTHATESYTIESDEVANYRSTNENFNMVSIGNVLEEELEVRGFETLHDTILHDYPSYNGAYKHSLETVQKYLENKRFNYIFDVHRDAISSDLTYGPVCEINGEQVAMLMFVVGTNASGTNHDNWMKNLKNAIAIQNRANEMYPRAFQRY